jgi:hypothetical protein
MPFNEHARRNRNVEIERQVSSDLFAGGSAARLTAAKGFDVSAPPANRIAYHVEPIGRAGQRAGLILGCKPDVGRDTLATPELGDRTGLHRTKVNPETDSRPDAGMALLLR